MTTNSAVAQTPASEAPTYQYKEWVRKIKALPFENMNSHELQQVWYLSWVAAVEFAEALRLAGRMYPDHPGLLTMTLGELETPNLALEEFQEPADHHEFLGYFLRKHGVMA